MDGRRFSAASLGGAAPVRTRSRVASPRPDAACPARRTTLVGSSRRPTIVAAPVARGARVSGRSREREEPRWLRFVHRGAVRGASTPRVRNLPESGGRVSVLREVDPREGVVRGIVDLDPRVPSRDDLHPAHLGGRSGGFAGRGVRGVAFARSLRLGRHRRARKRKEAPPERGFGRSLGSRGTMRARKSSAGPRIPEWQAPHFRSRPRVRGHGGRSWPMSQGKTCCPRDLRPSALGPGRRRRRRRHPDRLRLP